MSWYNQNSDFFIEEQKYVASTFPDLHYKIKNGIVYLIGVIHINCTVNNKLLNDSFHIKILFPLDYPEMFPIAFELSKKIPSSFHQFSNGELCLGTPLEIGLNFFQNKTVSSFINKLLMPYLIGFIYHRDYGEFPFGERNHGPKGQLELYQELLNTSDEKTIINFLNTVLKGNLKGHHLCPCRSSKSIRNCHWAIAQKLLIMPKKLIVYEIESLQSKFSF